MVLELITGEQLVVRGEAVIGRSPDPRAGARALRLPDPSRSLSRSHLRLRPDADGLLVHDLGSANGTMIVPRVGPPVVLPPEEAIAIPFGTVIRAGSVTFTVHRAARDRSGSRR